MKMWKWVVVGGCVAVLSTGCGRKPSQTFQEKMMEKAIEKQMGGKASVDLNGDSMSIKTEKGSMNMSAGKAAKIPASFPSDVHVYKGVQVEMAMELPNAHSVSMKSRDEVAKIAEIYKKEMTGNGWTQEQAMDMGEQTMLVYKKGDRAATVVISTQDGGSQIALTVASEKK